MAAQPQTLAPPAGGAPPRPPARRSAGSSLTRQWHGLPVWAWVVGGTVVAYLVWTRVLHKSSSTSTASVPSGAVGTTAPAGGGKVHETFPTGGSYTGPASSAPGYPKPTPGKSLGTAPAPGTTTAGTSGKSTPIVGTYQRAPSYTPRVATGKNYVPIKTWAQTLALASKGVAVYLWTAATGRPVPTSLAELKALEHTGTHAFPQFTVYQSATGGGASSSTASGTSGSTRRIALPSSGSSVPRWTPTGQKLQRVVRHYAGFRT